MEQNLWKSLLIKFSILGCLILIGPLVFILLMFPVALLVGFYITIQKSSGHGAAIAATLCMSPILLLIGIIGNTCAVPAIIIGLCIGAIKYC